MSEEQVVRLVKQYLQNHQYDNIKIEVVEGPIRKESTWWYVPVRPNHTETRTYRYYEELTVVEDELRENENLDVLLVPA